MFMRIHKYMAHAGVASRRKAEELVAMGKVTVNGVVAKIGQVIDDEVDVVAVGKTVIKPVGILEYYLFHKPTRVVSTVTDPEGRPTVLDYFPRGGARLYPVGRLDFESEGLMLLTNDGELAQRLTHPKYEVNKTYNVLIKGHPTQVTLDILRRGVHLVDGVTAPAIVEILREEGGNSWLSITIHEGKNREVRRMCEALHHPVLRLIRTKFGEWELGDLEPGKFIKISV